MKRFLYTLVVLIATLSFIMGVTSAAWARGGETWKIVPSPSPAGSTSSSFNSVAAVSPHDVWGVGYYAYGQNETAHAPLIEHWNGSRWKIVASPQSVTTGLAGVSADTANDAWAVGENFASYSDVTLAEHWNGHQWSIVPSPNQPAANALYSIVAISRNNIWADGSALTGDITSDTLVEHWDGAKWSIIPSPDGGSFHNFLYSVAAASATSIWAVGSYSPQAGSTVPSDTLVEHWDGAKWSVVASPNVAGAPGSFLSGVAVVSARDVWAVGYVIASQTTALIEHWNGVKWQIVAGPTGTNESRLNAVARVAGPKTAWAVGEMGGFALTEFHS